MTEQSAALLRGVFAEPHVDVVRRPDGSILLTASEPLAEHHPTVLHSFHEWVEIDPGQVLARERDAQGGWRSLTYGEADALSRSIGQALLDLKLGPDRPLLVLSENSLDHLIVMLGALMAGVPVASASAAYSLQSRDRGRLREICDLLHPGAVFATDADRFGQALDAIAGVPSIVRHGQRPGATMLGALLETSPGSAVERAFAALTPDSIAKVLFTSGSTGAPKGVLTSHGMLAANQQMIRQVWPFLTQERPAVVDWLPWSHTFGGSHNLFMILTSGGTLTVDGGRPAPKLFEETLRNLAEVPPTVYFNVPAGYAQLVPALEADPALAHQFFSRLRLIFNAAAALPDALRLRLQALAVETVGHEVPVTGAWGLTETAPAVTSAHFSFADARNIGVPLPGAEVLLVPAEEDYEIRVRGPMVTPGYLDRPDLTAACLDEEGFYRTGDAVALADPSDAAQGLLFRGRLAEDFKLDTGTFVRVGAVRTSLLSAIPLLADAVITGEDRDLVCALAWVNPAETQRLLGRQAVTNGEVISDPELAEEVARALRQHAESRGSAGRIARLLLMSRAADLDAGEITDKGYVNQRRVLALRRDLVDAVHADPPPDAVISATDLPQGVPRRT
jgi:feruloyl-CoA synthase